MLHPMDFFTRLIYFTELHPLIVLVALVKAIALSGLTEVTEAIYPLDFLVPLKLKTLHSLEFLPTSELLLTMEVLNRWGYCTR